MNEGRARRTQVHSGRPGGIGCSARGARPVTGMSAQAGRSDGSVSWEQCVEAHADGVSRRRWFARRRCCGMLRGTGQRGRVTRRSDGWVCPAFVSGRQFGKVGFAPGFWDCRVRMVPSGYGPGRVGGVCGAAWSYRRRFAAWSSDRDGNTAGPADSERNRRFSRRNLTGDVLRGVFGREAGKSVVPRSVRSLTDHGSRRRFGSRAACRQATASRCFARVTETPDLSNSDLFRAGGRKASTACHAGRAGRVYPVC